jgi:chemotaxis protein MotB
MAVLRRSRTSVNIWPGFVDGLATLLMVIIFLLMIFVVAQFYLSEAITGRDQALEILNQEVAELADLLVLEQKSNVDLRSNLAQLSTELQSTLTDRDDFAAELTQLRTLHDTLSATVDTLQARSEQAEAEGSALQSRLDEALEIVEVDKETIKVQLGQLLELQQDIAAMTALREEMEADLTSAMQRAETTEQNFAAEKEISVAAKAQVALLNRQIAALRDQMQQLNAALEGSESRDRAQKAQISDLGKRLNVALAGKVQELARYRSEFFGRLREVLGDRPDIQIVGDRFIFQSEVLFESGSAEIGLGGEPQLAQLARTLIDISGRIPADIAWILRIDGHTDRVPIRNEQFRSNWELSTARAISVVKFLIRQGIPANKLAATGFGEFQPIDDRIDEIAFRRNRRIELKLTER